MVASRTGNAVYLRNRARLMAKAKTEGVTHCPGHTDANGTHHPCGIELDYKTPGLPNSAEADHVISHRYGGSDNLENLRVLCRACNISKGDGSRIPTPVPALTDFPTTREW